MGSNTCSVYCIYDFRCVNILQVCFLYPCIIDSITFKTISEILNDLCLESISFPVLLGY